MNRLFCLKNQSFLRWKGRICVSRIYSWWMWLKMLRLKCICTMLLLFTSRLLLEEHVNIFIVIALHRWWSIKNKCVENTENICRYISCWNLLHIALDDEVYRVVIGTSPGWNSLTFNIAQPILRFYFKLTIFWEKQISWN